AGKAMFAARAANNRGELLAVGRIRRNSAGLIGPNLRGLLVFPLNSLVHFAAMHRNLARRLDPQSHAIAAHVDDGYDDIVTNNNALVALSGKNQHASLPRAFGYGNRRCAAWRRANGPRAAQLLPMGRIGPRAESTQARRATYRLCGTLQ